MSTSSTKIAGSDTLLGSGALADVHRFGAHALKLYHPGSGKAEVFAEAGILALLESHDLPVPRVHEAGIYDGRWGLVMDRIEGDTLGRQALADSGVASAVLAELVHLQVRLHGIVETRLRSLKLRLRSNIERAPGLPADLRSSLQERLAILPDGNRLCHGDLHPHNVIGVPGQTTVIDWLDAAAGAPAADAARSYLLLLLAAPQLADHYLALYAARSGILAGDIRLWLPVIAGARLAEKAASHEHGMLLELASSD